MAARAKAAPRWLWKLPGPFRKLAQRIESDGCTFSPEVNTPCCIIHDYRWRHSPPRRTWRGVKYKARSDLAFFACHWTLGWQRVLELADDEATHVRACFALLGYPIIPFLYFFGVALLGWIPWLFGNSRVEPGDSRPPWVPPEIRVVENRED